MQSHTPESGPDPVGEVTETWNELRPPERLAAFVLKRLERLESLSSSEAELEI